MNEEVLKVLESKKKDFQTFVKKYEMRKMEDLKQYYEGAKWALGYALTVVSDSKQE